MNEQNSVSKGTFLLSTLTITAIAIGISVGFYRLGNALRPHPIWIIPATIAGVSFILCFHDIITDIYRRLFRE